MSAPPLVSVRNLHRWFDDLHAVRGVSFDIPAKEVVGFIGANGAGKTTTMRMMATLDLPDSGQVLIDGLDGIQNSAIVRRKIGWMPDSYGAYEFMTVLEYLDFFAHSYGLRGKQRAERVRTVLEFIEMSDLQDRFIDSLSKGMGQRLCLARTLLHDPDILILDEPAAGLDPKARVEFKHLVRVLAEEGKTIFISSHILTELEDMCSKLLFIDRGKIIHYGSSHSLKADSAGKTTVGVGIIGETDKLREWISLEPGVKLVEGTQRGLRIEVDGAEKEAAALLSRMIVAGFQVYDFHIQGQRLEDAFIQILHRSQGGAKVDD